MEQLEAALVCCGRSKAPLGAAAATARSKLANTIFVIGRTNRADAFTAGRAIIVIPSAMTVGRAVAGATARAWFWPLLFQHAKGPAELSRARVRKSRFSRHAAHGALTGVRDWLP